MSCPTTPPMLKPVPNYPGIYASADGHVWSANKGANIRRLRGGPNTGGYIQVFVRRDGEDVHRQVYVQRLVLLTFFGPCPPGCQARHLDGDRQNNSVMNLQWSTPTQNARDRRAHGTDGRRYPEDVKRAAVDLCRAGWKKEAVAQLFGAEYGTVRRWVRSNGPTPPADNTPHVSER